MPASAWTDVDAVAVTHGPGPRRVAPRRDQLRQDARLGPRQAARRRQPPRGPPVRRLAARSGRGRARRAAGLPARRPDRVGRPHVPRRDARPPDVPAARPDGRRRRRRGVRQGRPAARAVVSGRAGDLQRGRGARRATTPPSRVRGSARRYDFSFSGLKTAARRTIDEARADEGLPTGRDAADGAGRSAVRRRHRRAGLGLPGRGRRRARHQDDARGRGDGRAVDRARRRRRGERRAPRAGWPARRRRAGCR